MQTNQTKLSEGVMKIVSIEVEKDENPQVPAILTFVAEDGSQYQFISHVENGYADFYHVVERKNAKDINKNTR